MENDPTATPPATSDERAEISALSFVVGYVVIIFGIAGFALLCEQLFGIAAVRMGCLTGGLLFVAAAIGKPRMLYLVVRNAGWFHHIKNPAAMRTILATIALLLFALGTLAPDDALK